MGNRAHVIFTQTDADDETEISPAVYLHWNGGPESVYAFLQVLASRTGTGYNPTYQAARFAAIVTEYFGWENGDSLGVTNGPEYITPRALADYDHGDNGVYVVQAEGGGWNVRRFSIRANQTRTSAKKWSAEAVAEERRTAQTHKTFAAILEALPTTPALAAAGGAA